MRTWTLQVFLVQEGDGGASFLSIPKKHPLSVKDLQGAKRDLLDACEAEGPGRLVHPTDGEFDARCLSCSAVETSSTRNMVEFSITFVEAGEITPPVTKKKSLMAQIAQGMKSAINTVGQIRRAARDINDKIQKIASGDIFSAMDGALGLTGFMTGTDLSAFQEGVKGIRDSSLTLAGDIEELTDQWQETVETLTESEDLRKLTDDLSASATTAQEALETTGLSASEETALHEAADISLMFVISALATAAKKTVLAEFLAYEDAIVARDQLIGVMEDLEGYITDQDLLDYYRDMNATLVEAIDEESIDLPRVRTFEIPAVTTILELANHLYGDTTRAQEIIDRNQIADPLAVSGAVEVLTE